VAFGLMRDKTIGGYMKLHNGNFTTYTDTSIILVRVALMTGWTDRNHPGFW
jgi:hypothetical protein